MMRYILFSGLFLFILIFYSTQSIDAYHNCDEATRVGCEADAQIVVDKIKKDGTAVNVSVWDFRGTAFVCTYYLDNWQACKSVHTDTLATESERESATFQLPRVTGKQLARFVLADRDISNLPRNRAADPVFYLSETKTTSLPQEQSLQDGSTTQRRPSIPGAFAFPKDPTRFANKQIADLFSGPTGLMQIIFGLALAGSFLFFALGAFKYMTSAGDAKKAEEARAHMTWAVVGLVVIVASFFLVQIVGNVFGIGITK